MPQPAVAPYCVLESGDPAAQSWQPAPVRHASVADATASASERGIYRVVVVSGGRRTELEPFAIVEPPASVGNR